MTTKNVEVIHRGGFAHPSSCERRRITNAENLIRLFVISRAAVGSLAWRREVAPLKAGDEATRDNQVILARRTTRLRRPRCDQILSFTMPFMSRLRSIEQWNTARRATPFSRGHSCWVSRRRNSHCLRILHGRRYPTRQGPRTVLVLTWLSCTTKGSAS